MASDGCQPLPRAQYPVYGVKQYYDAPHTLSHSAPHQQDSNTRGNTGTWYGAAPRGDGRVVPLAKVTQTGLAPKRERPGPGKCTAVLPGGGVMPLLALAVDATTTSEQLTAALQSGYRHMDCSPESNLTEVGRALAASGVPREQLFVTVKLGCEQHGEAAVAAAKAAKAALGVEALDVLSIGWPVALRPGTTEVDTTCTLEGTWAAMEAMVDSGVTRYIGVSNFDLPQVERVLACARIKPAVVQAELHPLCPQRKLVGVCKRYGLAIVALHPLGDGADAAHAAAAAVAASCGQTATAAVVRWNVQRVVGVAVAAADAAAGAAAVRFALTDDEKRQLDAIIEKNEDKRCFVPAFVSFAHPEEGGATKPSMVLGY